MNYWLWLCVAAAALAGGGFLYIALRWRRAPRVFRAMNWVAAVSVTAGFLLALPVAHWTGSVFPPSSGKGAGPAPTPRPAPPALRAPPVVKLIPEPSIKMEPATSEPESTAEPTPEVITIDRPGLGPERVIIAPPAYSHLIEWMTKHFGSDYWSKVSGRIPVVSSWAEVYIRTMPHEQDVLDTLKSQAQAIGNACQGGYGGETELKQHEACCALLDVGRREHTFWHDMEVKAKSDPKSSPKVIHDLEEMSSLDIPSALATLYGFKPELCSGGP